MKLFSSFLMPALVVSVCGATHALQGNPPPGVSPCLPFDPANTIDWPSTGHGSAASFGRAVVGLFSSASDTDRDAVIVAGGVAVHSRTIAAYKYLAPITFPTQPALLYVADVALLPGGGVGGTDTLLATDWRGLLRTSFRNGTFLNPVVIEGDDWIDAAPIHVVDADGQGGLDVIGVSADATKVLVLLANGSGYTESAISKPDPILDVVVADWDDDGAREFLVLTTAGLFAHSLNGALETSVSYAATSGAITCVTWRVGTNDTVEAVAWGRPKTSGGGELVVRTSTATDSTVDLAFDSCEPISFVPKAILAGNYDGNDDQDLLLVHEADQTAVVLVCSGTTPRFVDDDSFHDVIPLSVMPGGAGAVGLPAFDQVDGVGVDDLVVPVRASGNVEVFLNMDRHHINFGGQGTPPTSKDVIDDESLYFVNQMYQWHLAIEVPQQYRGYKWARVLLYEEPSAGALITHARAYNDHELVRDSTGNVVIPTQYVPVDYELPPGSNWSEIPPSQRPYFYVEVRFVDDDQTTLSPRYVAGMTLAESATPTFTHLLPNGIPPLLNLEFDFYPDPPPSSTQLGAYIPMSSTPAFANGEQPQLPQLTWGSLAFTYEDNGN
jgi:hypothetical protein